MAALSQLSADFSRVAQLQGQISVVSAFAAGCCYSHVPLEEVLTFVTSLDRDCKEAALSAAQVHLIQLCLVSKGLQTALFRANRIRLKKKQRADIPRIECAICTEVIEPADYLPLDSCGHMFHPACANEHLKTLIEQRKFPLACPFPACKADISDLDLQERLTTEEYRKCEELRFTSYLQAHPNELCACPGSDCAFVFERLGANPDFTCPLCKGRWCLDCRQPAHPLLTCPEAIHLAVAGPDQLLADLAVRQGLKKCPQCTMWVEKAEGCNYVVCRCGCKFCYLCGTGFQHCRCGGGFCPTCRADLQHCRCRRPPLPQLWQPAALHFQPQPQFPYIWLQPPFGPLYRQ